MSGLALVICLKQQEPQRRLWCLALEHTFHLPQLPLLLLSIPLLLHLLSDLPDHEDI